MSRVFNPPPNWPSAPPGWSPAADWTPDPAWGPAPPGWLLWLESEPSRPDPHDPAIPDTQHVFISYRRTDCQAQANGVYDGLNHRLKATTLFMDIDSIPPGVDFEHHIRDEISRCDVVLVMIGDNWLDRRPGTRRRRIDEADDFVRLEIENALATSTVRVIPVLVEGARMPVSAQLPESIRQLARLNAIELSDNRWTSDVERLAKTVEQLGMGSGWHSQPTGTTSNDPRFESAARALPTPPPIPVPNQPAVDFGPSGHWAGAGGRVESVRPRRRSAVVGWVIAAVPILTFGLGTFVPALWARSQRPGDRSYRRRMLIFGISAGVATIASIVVVGINGEGPSGSPAQNASDIGVAAWFGIVLLATVVAVVNRKPPLQVPGSAEEYQRRRRREEYRRLIRADVNLARSMAVGRPDLQRGYDDGGLLDLNSLSAEALVHFGMVPVDEAGRVVDARQRVRAFSTLDEVAARAGLAGNTVARLRDTAVFL
jgi:hypothetical protein